MSPVTNNRNIVLCGFSRKQIEKRETKSHIYWFIRIHDNIMLNRIIMFNADGLVNLIMQILNAYVCISGLTAYTTTSTTTRNIVCQISCQCYASNWNQGKKKILKKPNATQVAFQQDKANAYSARVSIYGFSLTVAH